MIVFGHYLLRQGIINLQQLVAVVDNRYQRMRALPHKAVELGFMTDEQARSVLEVQSEKWMHFSDAVQRLELLSEDQVKEVVAETGYPHAYIGESVVILGFASQEVISKALAEFEDYKRQHKVFDEVLPADKAMRENILDLFELSRVMLQFAWQVDGRAGDVMQMDSMEGMANPAWVEFSGDFACRYWVSIPDAVIEHSPAVKDHKVDDARLEFVQMLGQRTAGKLANRGKNVTVSDASLEPNNSTKVFAQPLGTTFGDVIAAVALT